MERLVALCRPVAWQIARGYAFQEADAADIVQDALLAVVQHLEQVRDPATFPQWFVSVAHNAARQWARREQAHRREQPLDPLNDGSMGSLSRMPHPSVSSAFTAVDTQDALRQLLNILPEREREAVLLAYLTGRTQAEIGRAFGISSRAVEGLLYRATWRLRAVTAQCADEFEDLVAWCGECGRRRLRGRLQLGFSAAYPLLIQATCPGCAPSNWQSISLALPNIHYPSLDAGLVAGFGEVGRVVRRLVDASVPHCLACGAAMHHERRWESAEFHWSCSRCDASVDTGLLGIAAIAPAFRAFWQASSRFQLDRHRLVGPASERVAVVTARDPLSGRAATVRIACDSLRVSALTVLAR